MKLFDVPKVPDAPTKTSVKWAEQDIEFSVVHKSYANIVDLSEMPTGKSRNAWLLTQLVLAENEEGVLVPLDYDRAAALPPKLGSLIQEKALELNGYGDLAAKN
jgi:hypothetical protein